MPQSEISKGRNEEEGDPNVGGLPPLRSRGCSRGVVGGTDGLALRADLAGLAELAENGGELGLGVITGEPGLPENLGGLHASASANGGEHLLLGIRDLLRLLAGGLLALPLALRRGRRSRGGGLGGLGALLALPLRGCGGLLDRGGGLGVIGGLLVDVGDDEVREANAADLAAVLGIGDHLGQILEREGLSDLGVLERRSDECCNESVLSDAGHGVTIPRIDAVQQVRNRSDGGLGGCVVGHVENPDVTRRFFRIISLHSENSI